MSDNGNGSNLKVPWLVLLSFLIGLAGWGYKNLDDKKADKELVVEMKRDIREIRKFLMGPPRD